MKNRPILHETNPNDISQINESGSGYAKVSPIPNVQPLGLGTKGPNKTRFTPFGFVAELNSRQVLPDNKWRNYLMFQNQSGADIFVGFGVNISANGVGGFLINPGGFYELDRSVPFSAIFISGTAGGQQLLVIEGIFDKNAT
jgi:hypothetical protein